MRRMLLTCLATLVGLGGWTAPAHAGFFSATAPVIAILGGELFLGEAEGYYDGTGTMIIRSRVKPEVICHGQFTSTTDLVGFGDFRCNDDATATFQFHRLSRGSGHGTGSSSRGTISFTCGLSVSESQPYLKLPAGKILRGDGKELVLADTGPPVSGLQLVSTQITSLPADEPDMLLKAATLEVIAKLKQDRRLQTNSPKQFTELVESTILPLFDFQHMTRLAVARNWRLASSEQQIALVTGFRALLLHTYASALTTYHDQSIEYKPLRMAPGETDVTVKSTMKQPNAERMSVDYDMEKTAIGWKIYDVRIADISLISTYRTPFAQTIREGGVSGLIDSLAARTRQTDAGLDPDVDGTQYFLMMYSVIRNFFRGGH